MKKLKCLDSKNKNKCLPNYCNVTTGNCILPRKADGLPQRWKKTAEVDIDMRSKLFGNVQTLQDSLIQMGLKPIEKELIITSENVYMKTYKEMTKSNLEKISKKRRLDISGKTKEEIIKILEKDDKKVMKKISPKRKSPSPKRKSPSPKKRSRSRSPKSKKHHVRRYAFDEASQGHRRDSPYGSSAEFEFGEEFIRPSKCKKTEVYDLEKEKCRSKKSLKYKGHVLMLKNQKQIIGEKENLKKLQKVLGGTIERLDTITKKKSPKKKVKKVRTPSPKKVSPKKKVKKVKTPSPKKVSPKKIDLSATIQEEFKRCLNSLS